MLPASTISFCTPAVAALYVSYAVAGEPPLGSAPICVFSFVHSSATASCAPCPETASTAPTAFETALLSSAVPFTAASRAWTSVPSSAFSGWMYAMPTRSFAENAVCVPCCCRYE